MPTSMSRRASVVLAGLACAGAMTLAQAAPMSFSVPLAGSQEVPPVQTQGTGTADLTYDPDTRVVKWTVTFNGLSSAAIMAHFHGPAPVGKNASPLVWLSQKGAMSAESPLTGQATLSPSDAQAFLAGNLYVNVHTKDHPAGEIRGQVVPPK
ncbi:CHRD domain-containing protein [Burkholderia ubonensis]|uniref:CHRD domain-containing protein n=1 Tax=Burkholderia ubonensis TaxID=101571 RepID=A0A107FUI6_9BURK|nr:CHRD domain-containing protein [Burkholderia ubonensis]KWD76859.1 CHRD domain-containing protein [Burkholderia ubonensis]KWD78911.1 CHRD domain-containing protein [Burkholderia ubonensis]KWD92858.1 CHRD domain-containing protein [Burkholderia ubonensis]KWD99927.1 CHRD domain-containing protein [Burkholderia ubonensis]